MPGNNSFRIIAGQWRSRKLNFHPVKDLRPTTDRIRETIFNWLMPVINGTECLDLFAGSGALGFEAASRGAYHVDLVEQHNKVFVSLKQNISLLAAENVSAINDDAMHYITTTDSRYDIIFLDPPYRLQLLDKCAGLINESAILKSGAHVYVEHPQQQIFNAPDDWRCARTKTAGNVVYELYQAS